MKKKSKNTSGVLGKRPEAELRQSAVDWADGRNFTHEQVYSPSDLQMVFMVLAMGALSGWSKKQVENIGLIFEDISKAGPRACNGFPMFMSCQMLNKADAEKTRAWAKELYDQKKKFVEGHAKV